MSRVVSLVTEGVTTCRSSRQRIIHGDLGQVKVWIDGPNLFQAVIKTFAVVDGACINKRLLGLKVHNGVGFGLLRLFMRGRQLYL